jgi:hypothetical protein
LTKSEIGEQSTLLADFRKMEEEGDLMAEKKERPLKFTHKYIVR